MHYITWLQYNAIIVITVKLKRSYVTVNFKYGKPFEMSNSVVTGA